MIRKRIMVPSVLNNPEVYYGKGAFSTIKYVEANNFLILASNSVRNTEPYTKLEKHLEGKTYTEDTVPDCSEDVVIGLKEKYSDLDPEVIILVGGGKVLDAGKILNYLLENPEMDLEGLKNQFYNEHKKTKVIAVPTTPATGSEVTMTAVLKNKDGKKTPYLNRSFVPDMAILDPSFLTSISKDLMVKLSADIFGHAYEGYVSVMSKRLIKAYSKPAIETLVQGLEAYHEDPGDIKALEGILYAGHLAGIVAGNAYVGVCHALAHSLEKQKPVGHSEAIMNLLRPCITWHQKVTESDEYSYFLERYDEIGFDKYLDSDILADLDIDQWAEDALEDPSIRTNPVRMKQEKILELIEWIKQGQ